MSNLAYPTLPGLGWPITKTSEWSTTKQRAASGKELRSSLYANPLLHWELKYHYLKNTGSAPTALNTLLDFFDRHGGDFDSFLFTDPDDNAVVSQAFGLGDGTTKNFQLSRQLVSGGFNAAIRNPNVISSIFRSDYQGNLQVFSTPRTNLLPASGDFSQSAWTKTNIT